MLLHTEVNPMTSFPAPLLPRWRKPPRPALVARNSCTPDSPGDLPSLLWQPQSRSGGERSVSRKRQVAGPSAHPSYQIRQGFYRAQAAGMITGHRLRSPTQV